MKNQTEKKNYQDNRAVANKLPKQKSNSKSTFQFINNRPEAFDFRTIQQMADQSRARQIPAFNEYSGQKNTVTAQLMFRRSSRYWSWKYPLQPDAINHWYKHGHEFGAKDSLEYHKMAQSFLKSNPSYYFIGKGGDRYYYDKSSNTMLVTNPSGEFKTFFKPDPNIHKFSSNDEYVKSKEKK